MAADERSCAPIARARDPLYGTTRSLAALRSEELEHARRPHRVRIDVDRVRNTPRSKATGRTALGRHRPAANSSEPSTSGSPNA
jgi:hypothetical protein